MTFVQRSCIEEQFKGKKKRGRCIVAIYIRIVADGKHGERLAYMGVTVQRTHLKQSAAYVEFQHRAERRASFEGRLIACMANASISPAIMARNASKQPFDEKSSEWWL